MTLKMYIVGDVWVIPSNVYSNSTVLVLSIMESLIPLSLDMVMALF